MSVNQIIQEFIKIDPLYKDIMGKLYCQYSKKELLIILKRKKKGKRIMQRKAKYGNEIIGKQFGQLTAVKPMGISKGGYHWEFKCSCGRTCKKLLSAVMANAKKGLNVSCGCRKKSSDFQEIASKNRRRELSQKLDKNNTSGVTGVSYDKGSDRWVAYLEINRVKHRRTFKNFNEAVICRKEWEEEYGMFKNI